MNNSTLPPQIIDPISLKRQQTIAEEEKFQAKNKKSLKILKRRLLIYLLLIAFFLLIIIFERAFFPYIQHAEEAFLETLQSSFHIDDFNESIPFFNFIGNIGGYRYFLLIITHVYLYLYFAIDAIMTIKIMVGHFIGLYIMYLLQLLYSVPRPFWISSKIVAFYCDGSFILPDDFVFTLFFMTLYSFYCYESRLKIAQSVLENESIVNPSVLEIEAKRRKIMQICKIAIWSLCIILMILRYLTGIMLLDSIFMTILYALIIFAILMFGESYFDDLIKRSVIEKNTAKRLLFHWMIILILLQCLAVILYLTANKYIPVLWINNYILCMISGSINSEDSYKVYISDSIGNWFTFIGTSVVIILLGGLCGAFRTMDSMNMNWYLGTYKQKFLRVLISYILLIPSWVLQFYLPKLISINIVTSFVINEFFLNMLHFTLILYIHFGYLPYYVFRRMKLTSDQDNTYDFLGGR